MIKKKKTQEKVNLLSGLFGSGKDEQLIDTPKENIEVVFETEFPKETEIKDEIPEHVDKSEEKEEVLKSIDKSPEINEDIKVDVVEEPKVKVVIIYKNLSEMSTVEYRRFRRTGIRAKK